MWKKINTEQMINSQKQILLSEKTADQLISGKNFFDNVKYALRVVRKTPYIEVALKI